MYQLNITRPALKVLRRIPANTAALIRQKLDNLAQNPYAPNANVKKLTSRPGYRLRVGEWRVIYTVHDDVLEILVIKIGPRGEVYHQ